MNDAKFVNRLVNAIINCYSDYNVKIGISKYEICDNGNRLIFHVELKQGTKIDQVFKLEDDIQHRLGLPVFKMFRDELSIYIAVSGNTVMENSLSKILQSNLFVKSSSKIPFAVGYDLRGRMYIDDLDKMKHLLIGGSTNSGKTVALICLIFSIITKQSPDNVNLILFDIGASGLEIFNGIPHLSCPVIKDEEIGISVIQSLFKELDRRNNLSDKDLELLPSIVCIIDEFVSFVSNISNKETSKILTNTINNLLRKGRNANIHIVLATQDSKVKSMAIDLGNIRARMAFSCGNLQDSVSLLGESGAEDLPGNGTMLFKSHDRKKPIYLQGAFISKEEQERVVKGEAFRTMVSDAHEYNNKFIITETTSNMFLPEAVSDIKTLQNDKELADIILWVLSRNNVSANKMKETFNIGNRSSTIIDKLFSMEIISDKNANLPRDVLPKGIQDIPIDVMKFLEVNGISDNDIITTFQKRFGNKPFTLIYPST